ncbi:MAG: aminotransferase class V-fold PLP-dependent enzyme [Anaerolineae bacterium]|nr:aminotransferase class V-fold PLP-dependent enzyme [Thermoflexales bacterium]MDW8407639.1 aminotransferase class V-fold PLP-dependent enzyme [Anaerolineae bacterium]
MRPQYDLNALRRQIPAVQSCIYLNTCAIGPWPDATRHAVAHVADMLAEPNRLSREFWAILSAARENIARLINAAPDEIAFMPNTAEGMNVIAHALPLQAGDNVLMCDQEYPAVVYPFMNLARLRGIEARIVPHDGGGLTLDLLERHADARTRAVAVSSVEFVSGFSNDLKAIGAWCKARGAWLIVDGIQSLGAAPLDVKAAQIDALASGGHKWMLGPMGAGFLYVNRERLNELAPPFAGALSVIDAENYLDYNLTFQPDARRFELGVPNAIGLAGLSASISVLLSLDIAAIHEWTLYLSDALLYELERLGYHPFVPRDCGHRSAIVSFTTSDPAGVAQASQRLSAAGIVHSIRSGYVRFGIHGFNNEEDIRAAITALGPLK